MALIRRDDNPFRELEDLMQNRWSNLLGDPFARPSQPALATPTANVYMDEDEQNMVAEIQLPGFSEDDIEVNIEDNTLNIRAERSERDEDEDKKGRKYIVRESASSFFRRIGLPENVDTDNISANFDEGVLTVTVPMQELPKPKQVNIESGKKNKKENKSK